MYIAKNVFGICNKIPKNKQFLRNKMIAFLRQKGPLKYIGSHKRHCDQNKSQDIVRKVNTFRTGRELVISFK
jgi:hypothetical protein